MEPTIKFSLKKIYLKEFVFAKGNILACMHLILSELLSKRVKLYINNVVRTQQKSQHEC